MLRFILTRKKTAFLFKIASFLLSASLLASAQTQPVAGQQPKIPWQSGPLKAKLGTAAEIEVPAGFLFADGDAARRILELNGNPPSGDEVGVMTPADKNEDWFVFSSFTKVDISLIATDHRLIAMHYSNR